MKETINFIRAVVRPSLTWIGFIVTAGLVIKGVTVPDWWIAMISMMLAFWFASRSSNGGSAGH